VNCRLLNVNSWKSERQVIAIPLAAGSHLPPTKAFANTDASTLLDDLRIQVAATNAFAYCIVITEPGENVTPGWALYGTAGGFTLDGIA
jgi:hypothetical protein